VLLVIEGGLDHAFREGGFHDELWRRVKRSGKLTQRESAYLS
jgi:hypothetical protein